MTDAETTSGPLRDAVEAITAGDGAPPGACLAVSRGAGLTWTATGVAQAFDDSGPLVEPPPIALQTRTDIGSVTKVVACATALQSLVSAGEVTLEHTLSAVLPWTRGLPAGSATLRDLLEHRAGLWEWWPLYLSAAEPDDALRIAASLPRRYPAGEARRYSDVGFQLLGAAIAAVSGADLATAVGALVLDPLDLRCTRFARPVAGAPACASSTGDRIERAMIDRGVPYPVRGRSSDFAGWRTGVLIGEVNDGNAFHALSSVAGHAGLFSTASDLARFGDALLAGLSGSGPFAPDVARRLLTPGADPAQGLGFRRWSHPSGDAWGHTGFPGVAMAIVPRLDASVVMVTNRLHVAGEPALTERLWEIALAAARRHCAGG